MSSATDAKRLLIRGRVQGVGFRESMRYKAEELGVVGWVRNCGDGTVEALVGGEAAAVQRLIAWAQHGPPLARVERVDVIDASPAALGGARDFRRAPSLLERRGG